MKKWYKWWLDWPLSRWMDEQAGRHWFKREGDRFLAAFPCPEKLRPDIEAMTAELVDYRLAHYAKTRIEKAAELSSGRFLAKVSHSGGKPILRLPTVEELPGRPIGPTTATLPDGSQWVFKFVKIACNVASPLGSEENRILPLLRGWFGENAGAPGTNYQVAFTRTESGWAVEPVAVATPLRVVESSPETGESDEPETHDLPGFVEAPPPRTSSPASSPSTASKPPPASGDRKPLPRKSAGPRRLEPRSNPACSSPAFAAIRWSQRSRTAPGTSSAPAQKAHATVSSFSSNSNPPVDLENGGRFTVKKYRSVRRVTEDDWSHEYIELLPLNRDYDPIVVNPLDAPEMVVVGEWLASID